MIFYFPIWALYLTYLTNYYNEFIDTFVKNLRFVKWLINIWCFLICLSMIIPSSYEGNGVLVGNFKSFSEGSFRIAPTILLMGIIIWLYSAYSGEKNYILLFIIPFISIALTGSRTYMLLFLILFIKVFYSFFRKKIYFFLLLIPVLIVIWNMVVNTAIADKFYDAINNKYVTDPLARFTSGRSVFWEGEIDLFFKARMIEQLFGGGLTSSFTKNMIISNQAIWAHNDFLEVLNAHGVVGVYLYITFFIRFYKRAVKSLKIDKISKVIFLIICIANAMINGLYVYITAALAIPFLLQSMNVDFKKINVYRNG